MRVETVKILNMKKGLLFAVFLLLLAGCAGKKDEEVNLEKLKYKDQKDARKTAEAPVKLKDGYNFSVFAPDARVVSLVGDFNNWLDNRHPMQKNENGVWFVTVPLKKGEYSYKFNIDNVWVVDHNNPEAVKDTLGDRRSLLMVKEDTLYYKEPVYFGYTNAFLPRVTMSGVLFAYQDRFARNVSVAGTFNSWEKNDFPLKKNINGVWYGYVQIPKGEYEYKYVVDGLWKHDPVNPASIDDGFGDIKSRLVVEQDIEDRPDRPLPIDYEIVRFRFYDKNLPSSYSISVLGTFNDWRSNLTVMRDDDYDKEWFTTVRLKEGEYYYKFLLAGREFFDPENGARQISPENKEASYLKIVLPRDEVLVKFTYKGDRARDVFLAGDFNNWNAEADRMEKDQYGLWYRVKRLTRGRYLYQYVVDGKWMTDMNNPYAVRDPNNDMNSYLEIR